MSLFLKALIGATVLYFIHVFFLWIFANFEGGRSSYVENIFGAAIYIFIIAFWVYYLVALAYFAVGSQIESRKGKIVLSLFLLLIGYFLSRGGDIIDGDFWTKFRISVFIAMLLSSLSLVYTDQALDKWIKSKPLKLK
jgi:hypothetical protein